MTPMMMRIIPIMNTLSLLKDCSLHVKAVDVGSDATGVDDSDGPGACIVGVVEGVVLELAGAEESGGVAGVGVALRIVVGNCGPALEGVALRSEERRVG